MCPYREPDKFFPAAVERAKRALEAAGDDTEKRRVAERDKLRWEEFLRIAEDS